MQRSERSADFFDAFALGAWAPAFAGETKFGGKSKKLAPFAEGRSMSGEHIVVVEDDPMSQRLMVDLLVVTGYKVKAFGDAESGLVAMHAAPPDLVLMDIRLPGMDGFAALTALRTDPATVAVPVIAVTASVMLGEREKIMQAGFTGYHPKPIQIAQLLKEIEQTLANG